MALLIENKYSIGDIVYLITDVEQIPRMVFCYVVYKNELVYKVCAGTVMSEHYDFELSPDKVYAQ